MSAARPPEATPLSAHRLAAGLADPVHDSQRAFRAALDALARPGTPVTVGAPVAGLALSPALAHLLLMLADDDTPVWWQPGGTVEPAQGAAWLRFHTGAPQAADAAQAQFAVLTDPGALPPLAAFAAGSDEAPETSATLLIELPALVGGPACRLSGPGIATPRSVHLAGLPAGWWGQWQANQAAFPRGVDLLFTCGVQVLGLPRGTQAQPEAA